MEDERRYGYASDDEDKVDSEGKFLCEENICEHPPPPILGVDDLDVVHMQRR